MEYCPGSVARLVLNRSHPQIEAESALRVDRPKLFVGARASARLGVWMGRTPECPHRSGVLKLKRRKRRAPLPTKFLLMRPFAIKSLDTQAGLYYYPAKCSQAAQNSLPTRQGE